MGTVPGMLPARTLVERQGRPGRAGFLAAAVASAGLSWGVAAEVPRTALLRDLEIGARQVDRLSFEAARLTLEGVTRGLAAPPAPPDPDLARAHILLGAAYLGLGREAEALEQFLSARRADPRQQPEPRLGHRVLTLHAAAQAQACAIPGVPAVSPSPHNPLSPFTLDTVARSLPAAWQEVGREPAHGILYVAPKTGRTKATIGFIVPPDKSVLYFQAVWPVVAPLEKINSWNSTRAFSRAFVGERTTTLHIDLDLTGGVTLPTWQSFLDICSRSLTVFESSPGLVGGSTAAPR